MRVTISYVAAVAALASAVSAAGTQAQLVNAIEGDKSMQAYCWASILSASPMVSTVPNTQAVTTIVSTTKTSTQVSTTVGIKTVFTTIPTTKTVKTSTKSITVTAKAKRDEMPTPILEARGAVPTGFKGYNSKVISNACSSASDFFASTKTTGSPSTATSVETKSKTITSTSTGSASSTIAKATTVSATATVTSAATITPISKAVYAVAVANSAGKLYNVQLDDSDLLSQSAGPHVYFGFSSSNPTASSPSGMFKTQDSPAQCLAYIQYYQAFGVTDCSNATETTFSLDPSTGVISQPAVGKGVAVNKDKSLSIGGKYQLTWADINDN